MMTCLFTILGMFLLCHKKNLRCYGYIALVVSLEFNSKAIGYTETELCLNDIIVILFFILFEIWNKFRKEKQK